MTYHAWHQQISCPEFRMKVLRINTSLFDNNAEGANVQGVSTQLTDLLVNALMQINPELQLLTRDFGAEPVPHFDGARLRALSTSAEERTFEQQQMVEYSDRLIAELKEASVLVLAAPMYNFSIPSTLKSWIDHVARAGVSFQYTESGPIGLMGGRKVYVAVTSGGVHEPGVTDHVRPYLSTVLGFLGLEDIEFITASGLNMGAEARAQGLQHAHAQIAAITAGLRESTEQRGKAA
jgi:FMN-dependent NADH-azoreductase